MKKVKTKLTSDFQNAMRERALRIADTPAILKGKEFLKMETQQSTEATVQERNEAEIKQSNESMIPAVPAQTKLEQAGEFENLDREDFKIPRVKLLQNTSAEVSDGIGTAGDFLNQLSLASYGNSLVFTPITLWKSRVFFEESKVVCRSANGKESVDGYICELECPHNVSKWGPDRTPPRCALAYNYLILPENENMPAIIQLAKTSFSAGRSLNTMLVAERCPIWNYEYELRAIKKSNKFGTYFIMAAKKHIINGNPIKTTEDKRKTAIYFRNLWTKQKPDFEDEIVSEDKDSHADEPQIEVQTDDNVENDPSADDLKHYNVMIASNDDEIPL